MTRLVCLFHLNLAYSSLEEEERGDVIARCYHPLLDLAERSGFPVGIEANAWTFEQIAELDPDWLDRCRRLVDAGRVEIVGSGYAQVGAPLLPALANEWNIRLGREAYERLLGVAPRLALIPEQAYSAGVAALYREAGYEAIVADWDNAYRSHPDWPETHRAFPQRALDADGETIPVVWSQSIVFQKFQRYAHGDLSLDEYLDYLRGVCASRRGALLLYANDAEIFDRRPGRFPAEPAVGDGEWARLEHGLRAILEAGLGRPSLPADLLDLLGEPEAGHVVRVESTQHPIPVKKQDKYNVSRWATTGRDDVGVNTRCQRLYEALRDADCSDPEEWRELCRLWASDFRTHITARRWSGYLERLAAFERRWPAAAAPRRREGAAADGVGSRGRLLVLAADGIELALDPARGLAIDSFVDESVSAAPLIGTIRHGYFDSIELGADWYSGTLVHESPLSHKATDLVAVVPEPFEGPGCLGVATRVSTELGEIEKTVTLDLAGRAVEIEYTLHWSELPLGTTRLGFVTLMPETFDRHGLWFGAHNGGRTLERFEVDGAVVDLAAPVSALVSCRQGLGMSEGLLVLGDASRAVVVEVDQAEAKPLGLIVHRPAKSAFLFRAMFSLAESDETRQGGIERPVPQTFRQRVRACRTADLP